MSLFATTTILDKVKTEINDPANRVFSDDEYTSFIESHIIEDYQVTLTKSNYANFFRCNSKAHFYISSFEVDPTFIGSGISENDFEYTYDEYSLIYKPISTETRSQIIISGLVVDFSGIIVAIYRALAADATRAAYIYSGDGEKIDKRELSRWCIRMAEMYKGVFAF